MAATCQFHECIPCGAHTWSFLFHFFSLEPLINTVELAHYEIYMQAWCRFVLFFLSASNLCRFLFKKTIFLCVFTALWLHTWDGCSTADGMSTNQTLYRGDCAVKWETSLLCIYYGDTLVFLVAPPVTWKAAVSGLWLLFSDLKTQISVVCFLLAAAKLKGFTH